MSWPELFIVLGLSHLVGDFMLQTDWQVQHKPGGFGRDPVARRALGAHVLTYTLAIVPALVWIAIEREVWVAVVAAIAIALPHAIIDDRRLLTAYVRRVKGLREPMPGAVFIAVDQTTHLVMLWAVALAVV
jgi:hypothetical protein